MTEIFYKVRPSCSCSVKMCQVKCSSIQCFSVFWKSIWYAGLVATFAGSVDAVSDFSKSTAARVRPWCGSRKRPLVMGGSTSVHLELLFTVPDHITANFLFFRRSEIL